MPSGSKELSTPLKAPLKPTKMANLDLNIEDDIDKINVKDFIKNKRR